MNSYQFKEFPIRLFCSRNNLFFIQGFKDCAHHSMSVVLDIFQISIDPNFKKYWDSCIIIFPIFFILFEWYVMVPRIKPFLYKIFKENLIHTKKYNEILILWQKLRRKIDIYLWKNFMHEQTPIFCCNDLTFCRHSS